MIPLTMPAVDEFVSECTKFFAMTFVPDVGPLFKIPVTIDAALVFVFDSARIVFDEMVRGAVADRFEIPTTDADELVPVPFAAVDRFRTVFPVIVFPPLDTTMPPMIRLVFAAEGT